LHPSADPPILANVCVISLQLFKCSADNGPLCSFHCATQVQSHLTASKGQTVGRTGENPTALRRDISGQLKVQHPNKVNRLMAQVCRVWPVMSFVSAPSLRATVGKFQTVSTLIAATLPASTYRVM
jgi:hypothetical protein